METQPVPDLPKEVIPLILSNLGQNDLLKCRLVNSTWIQESEKILKSRNYTQYLNSDKIKKFIQFSSNSKKLILPFHIRFDVEFMERTYYFTNFANDVNNLIDLMGEGCIWTLELDHILENLSESFLLIKLLGRISGELRTLILEEVGFVYAPEYDNGTLAFQNKAKVMDYLKKQNLTFPNVKSVKLVPDRVEGQILEELLKRCPNVEELDVSDKVLDWCLRLPSITIEKLKKLTFGTCSKKCLEELEEIFKDNPPLVETLKLHCIDQSTLGLVTLFSKSLKSLSISLGTRYQRNDPVLIRFPELLQLQNLQFFKEERFSDLSMPIFLSPEECNLIPDNFPSLKSVDVPIGCFFADVPASDRPPIPDLRQIPSVTQLTIRANKCNFSADIQTIRIYWSNLSTEGVREKIGDSVKKNVENVLAIFPNVSKLTLVNDWYNNDEILETFIREVFVSNSSENIKELEILGCTQDHLGRSIRRLTHPQGISCDLRNIEDKNVKTYESELKKMCATIMNVKSEQLDVKISSDADGSFITIDEPQNSNNGLKNLEKIRLAVDYNYNQEDFTWEKNAPVHLPEMLSSFPNLKEIQISKKAFGGNVDYSHAVQMQIMCAKISHPKCNIYTI